MNTSWTHTHTHTHTVTHTHTHTYTQTPRSNDTVMCVWKKSIWLMLLQPFATFETGFLKPQDLAGKIISFELSLWYMKHSDSALAV